MLHSECRLAAIRAVLIQTRGPMPGRTLAAAPVMTMHVREATQAVVAALRALPGAATDIQSPFGPAGPHMIGPGGRSALVTFQVAGPHSQADTRVVRALDAVAAVQSRYPDLNVSETGGASVDRAATAMLGRDFHKAELTSVPLTLVLLLLVFGALIAASIPVILAGTAVTATVSLLAIPSRWLPIGQGTSEVVLIIGMAVGIDYTLFYLRREREERAAGPGFHDALRTAAATSGRAIVVSGLTVMISLAGLLFTGIDMFTGFAIGTMLVVGIAVVGSLTALPALLALLGPWADRARVPFLGKGRTRADQSRLWSAVVERVVRHPVAWGGLAVIALAALAAPALGMRIGQPAINLPSSLPGVRTLDHIQRDFPGGPAPAQVVVAGPGVQTSAMQRAITGIEGLPPLAGRFTGP
jgi:RND superfamily putative drug exporter